MFCPNCGTEGTGNFCTSCGHALKRQAIVPEASLQDRPQNIIGKRLSNALIKDAEPDFGVFFDVADVVGLGAVKSTLTAELSVFKKLMGGLWVGGTTYLTEDAIKFRPNLINRLLHKGDCSVSIPLGEITDVKKRFGIVTQIIDIITTKGTLSIRCYGSGSFFEMINAQIKDAPQRTKS